jgi:DNA-binding SARP family transcriptional activator
VSQNEVDFRVLGPLEIRAGGRFVRVSSRLSRALLATLLVHAGQVLTPDQLIDDLWGVRPPSSARMCLHNLVSGLRRAIRPDVVQTVSAGYVLHVAPGNLDALRFEHLIASTVGAGPRERARTLGTALELWRGSPFVDVRYESFAQAEIGRLEELHVWALEQ